MTTPTKGGTHNTMDCQLEATLNSVNDHLDAKIPILTSPVPNTVYVSTSIESTNNPMQMQDSPTHRSTQPSTHNEDCDDNSFTTNSSSYPSSVPSLTGRETV